MDGVSRCQHCGEFFPTAQLRRETSDGSAGVRTSTYLCDRDAAK